MKLLVLVLLAGCTARTPAPACTTAPQDTDIAPVLQAECLRCHANGGAASEDHDFSSVTTLHAQRPRIGADVTALVMPPPGAQKLTDAERELLEQWAACGH